MEATLLIALKTMKNITLENIPIDTTQDNIINLGMGQKYNLQNRTFYINNLPISLTKNELNILYVFCKNINQNISYDTFHYEVWNHKEISRSTIRDIVSRLKKKTPNLTIENVINFGYILKV